MAIFTYEDLIVQQGVQDLSPIVYVNKVNGVAGTEFPIGLPGAPVNNEADAITILVGRNLGEIHFQGNQNYTAPSDMTGIVISGESYNNSSLALNGKSFDLSVFRSLYAMGIARGSVVAEKSYLQAVTVDSLEAHDCIIGGALTLTVGVTGHFADCKFNVSSHLYIPNSGATLYHCSGEVTVHDVAGTATLYVFGAGLHLILDSSCTGGTVIIEGDVRLDDNSAGTTVINYVKRIAGKRQTFSKRITSAANAGDVVVATVTSQGCNISSVTVRSNGATTANLTSAAVSGGAGKVITFVDATSGAQAHIAAADQQVSWMGKVSLPVTKTIVMTLTGSGSTAVDLTVDIEYEAQADGGYLA